MKSDTKLFLIKLAYWLGIAADALWAVALLIPGIYGLLTGVPNFDPDLQTRVIMAIGGTLMLGWTLLLIWAVQNPIERRMVILLTAFPVVFGMFVIALIQYLEEDNSSIWILAKTVVLMVSMFTSYVLARQQKTITGK